MGVILSYFIRPENSEQSNEPDAVTGLTPKEKLLMENSWNLVKKDLVEYGVQIFIVLVTKYPQYKKLFSFRDVPNEELPNNRKIKGHATNVMYALAAILENLNNNEVLVELLEMTGESHGKRKVEADAYWKLKGCIMEVLQTGLGSKFTPETRAAWDKTITVAFTVIVKNLAGHQQQ